MKYSKVVPAVLLAAALILPASGCSKIDRDYGVESSSVSVASELSVKDTAESFPVVRSSDTVMTNYIDLSQYDEENYSDIYLGKKFDYKVTYAGKELTVPTDFRQMSKKGWELAADSAVSKDALILACEGIEADLVNEDGIKLKALFYNSSKSSVKLEKCPLVKLSIEDNNLYNPDCGYGDFSVNGVTNRSAITDIVETLGSPSHFYAISPTEYYLDYFITKDDRRNGITVYVDPTDDSVISIEFAYYK